MFTYIKKDIIGNYIESDIQIDTIDGYQDSVGTTWEDYLSGKFLLLSPEQVAFHNEFPNLSVENVWNMTHPSSPDLPEQPEDPEYTEEELLQIAKEEKIQQVLSYDADVTVFRFGNELIWIDPNERANYLNTIQSAKRLGIENVSFMGVTITADTAIAMLDSINVYAMQICAVTEQHKNNIMRLTSISDVENYDNTLGYPQMLNFDIQ